MPTVQTNARTIKFCATGKSGLGHLRRVCNIATQVKVIAPSTELVLVTNASIAGIADAEAALFSRVHICSRQEMAHVLVEEKAGPVVVDTAVIPGIEALAAPLCLILRETVAAKVGQFKLGYGRTWDAVIIPSPRDHWTIGTEALGAKQIHYAGWIFRSPLPGPRVLPEPMDIPTLLIATGGGGSTETARELAHEIDGILTQLRRLMPVRVLHAAGPRLPREGRLNNACNQIDVGSRLNLAFSEADAVISTVGYNSVLELAAVSTPALLVPISRTFDDQKARAHLWSERLGTAHTSGSHAASATWLAEMLSFRTRRAPVDLGGGADTRAAEILLDLAPEAPDIIFTKPAGSHKIARLGSRISASLAEAGAPVIPALYDSANNSTLMPRIVGHDGRTLAGIESASSPIGTLKSCIAALAKFHAAGFRVDRIGLREFDPLAKVRPRLAGCPYANVAKSAAQMANLIERELMDRDPECQTVVHGDFHAGQVVFPAAGGPPAIVDFDDVAAGAPEADLGNFIAHAATCPAITNAQVQTAVDVLTTELTSTYRHHAAQIVICEHLVQVYCAAALVRRALKLALRHEPEPIVNTILTAAHMSLLDRPDRARVRQSNPYTFSAIRG